MKRIKQFSNIFLALFFLTSCKTTLKDVNPKINPNKNINENNTSTSLISRLSNVKNKAIDVGTKAFSMVSEVANKPFEGKSTNLEEGKEFDINNDNQNANNERIEPSFIDNNEQKNYGQVSYEDNFDRGLVSDDDKMNIPSFLRRNRD